MVAILAMFKTSNMKKPIGKINSFLNIEPLTINAKNVANMINAINEYSPEQGKSTAK